MSILKSNYYLCQGERECILKSWSKKEACHFNNIKQYKLYLFFQKGKKMHDLPLLLCNKDEEKNRNLN